MSRHYIQSSALPHTTYFHKELIFKVSDVAFEAIKVRPKYFFHTSPKLQTALDL